MKLELSYRGIAHAYGDSSPSDGAPVVLFLHGLLVSSEVWALQMRSLANTHRVLAIDWPGHGASRAASQCIEIGDLAETALLLLDRLGVRRAALVGLSLGGIVALEAAARHPERVEALALVSTPFAQETDAQKTRHLETLAAASRIARTPILKGIALRLFGVTTRRERPELVEHWLDAAARLDLDSIRNLGEAAMNRGVATLAGASPRAVVVRGDEDTLLDPLESEALARRLGATLVTVPKSGHLVPIERPEALTDALVTFLASA